MKIRLLNDGCYGDMENVNFPVEVEAKPCGKHGFTVCGADLIHVGAERHRWEHEFAYYFSVPQGDCEVVE
jgi:hypothetical protein